MDFENKVFEGIYTSRYIASWQKGGGNVFKNTFKEWLRSLVINGKHLDEDDVTYIVDFARNGKLELGSNAKMFIKEHKN